jgi:pimeloyl-ACP methyl ester carboxylesterase
MNPTIENIQIPGLKLNARVFGPQDGLPVLGLHGWLDNAATFDLIAPRLSKLRVVSVDFPGHGFSEHLPACVSYSNTDRSLQMLQVVDALGWNEFSILGHSMGGIVGELMAAIAPERVKKIALIDVFGGSCAPAQSIISQLKRHVFARERSFLHSVFPSLDDAAKMRAHANLTMTLSVASARILAEGGMREVSGGYSWTFDQRLQSTSPLLLTDEQLKTVLENFNSDCALIVGSEGNWHELTGHNILKEGGHLRWNNEAFPNVRFFELKGGHYLHLDTPDAVAAILENFFQ